jgi:thiol-disulfide isomerase/thioredoxin
MKGLVALILIAAGIAALVIFYNPNKSGTSAAAPAAAGGSARVIQASDFRLEDYKGQVVVLDFWATWCGPCKMAMPGVQKLHEHFQGRPVQVFGVNCWERGDPGAYMRDNGFTYGLVMGGDDLAKKYKVDGIPTFVVIGIDGERLQRSVGFDPAGEGKLRTLISDHLTKNGL